MFHFSFLVFYCLTSIVFDLGHIYNKSEKQKVTLEQNYFLLYLFYNTRFTPGIILTIHVSRMPFIS